MFEVVGKEGAVEPKHNGPMALKIGVIELVISISMVVVRAHAPTLGVKV